MKFIDNIYTTTHEVKQSKFIAYLTPYSKYHQTLKKLKDEHPKARHFVVAYRYLNEFKQVVEHSSDDGEPKGTSGKPSLMVLQGWALIDSAVIIVRYFGGTKLGTGGLVRAYSDAVNLVINNAILLEYRQLVSVVISFKYADVRVVEYECSEHHIEILDKVFDTEATYTIKASVDEMELFLEKLTRVVRVNS